MGTLLNGVNIITLVPINAVMICSIVDENSKNENVNIAQDSVLYVGQKGQTDSEGHLCDHIHTHRWSHLLPYRP